MGFHSKLAAANPHHTNTARQRSPLAFHLDDYWSVSSLVNNLICSGNHNCPRESEKTISEF